MSICLGTWNSSPGMTSPHQGPQGQAKRMKQGSDLPPLWITTWCTNLAEECFQSPAGSPNPGTSSHILIALSGSHWTGICLLTGLTHFHMGKKGRKLTFSEVRHEPGYPELHTFANFLQVLGPWPWMLWVRMRMRMGSLLVLFKSFLRIFM